MYGSCCPGYLLFAKQGKMILTVSTMFYDAVHLPTLAEIESLHYAMRVWGLLDNLV